MRLTESASSPRGIDQAVEPMLAWLETPVSEFMIRNPVCVDEHESVRLARARMMHAGVGHLPVVAGGRPVGLVTARDLARSIPITLTVIRHEEVARVLAQPVSAIMSSPAVTLPADATLEEAVQLMVKSGVGSVIVTDPRSGKLAGLITRSTITRAVANLSRDSV